jgi:hypothetical protein
VFEAPKQDPLSDEFRQEIERQEFIIDSLHIVLRGESEEYAKLIEEYKRLDSVHNARVDSFVALPAGERVEFFARFTTAHRRERYLGDTTSMDGR